MCGATMGPGLEAGRRASFDVEQDQPRDQATDRCEGSHGARERLGAARAGDEHRGQNGKQGEGATESTQRAGRGGHEALRVGRVIFGARDDSPVRPR